MEKHTAEVEKFHLMEQTVNEALREARMNQQSIRNKINAMVDDSYATEVERSRPSKSRSVKPTRKPKALSTASRQNWTNYVKVPKKPSRS